MQSTSYVVVQETHPCMASKTHHKMVTSNAGLLKGWKDSDLNDTLEICMQVCTGTHTFMHNSLHQEARSSKQTHYSECHKRLPTPIQ